MVRVGKKLDGAAMESYCIIFLFEKKLALSPYLWSTADGQKPTFGKTGQTVNNQNIFKDFFRDEIFAHENVEFRRETAIFTPQCANGSHKNYFRKANLSTQADSSFVNILRI